MAKTLKLTIVENTSLLKYLNGVLATHDFFDNVQNVLFMIIILDPTSSSPRRRWLIQKSLR